MAGSRMSDAFRPDFDVKKKTLFFFQNRTKGLDMGGGWNLVRRRNKNCINTKMKIRSGGGTEGMGTKGIPSFFRF